MKKKIVWLVVTGLMVVALLVTSCAPAIVEKKEVAPPTEKEEVAPPKEREEVVVPGKEAEMVKFRLTKRDGTVVEKMMEKPRYGGVLRIGYAPAAIGFDQAIHPVGTWASFTQTNEELVFRDYTKGPTGTFEESYAYSTLATSFYIWAPRLAESWELVDDTTMVFHIRKGVRFALDPRSAASRLVNGREVNAYDVEYSLNRELYAPNSYNGITYGRALIDGKPLIESFKATDKWTFVMKLAPGAMGLSMEIWAAYTATIAHEVVEKYGDITDWKNSVGTGPFILVDYVDGSSMTFEKNPDYWGHDHFFTENQIPYIDGFKYIIIPDMSTRLAALRTGKIDQMQNIGWEDAASLKKTNPKLKYQQWYATDVSSELTFRVDKPELPFYDIRVRRALAMAVDQQKIRDEFYGGEAVLPGNPVPLPEFKGIYTPLEELPESVRELLEYHPDKARQLLAEAGYPNGFKTEVLTRAQDVDMLSIIKEYWAKVGVDLKIDVREVGVFTTIGTKKTYNALIIGRGGSFSTTLPYGFIFLRTGAGLNTSMNSDPRIDEVAADVSANHWDDVRRDQLLKESIPYVYGKALTVVLPVPYRYTFWQPWVKQYGGEWSVGRSRQHNYAMFIWLDLDLREAMTGKR